MQRLGPAVATPNLNSPLALAWRLQRGTLLAWTVGFAVLGAVTRPGSYPLTPGVGLAEALATAGSLTEFAHRDRIFVLRKLPQAVRIRFSYRAITGEQGAASAFRLRAGDVVVVE